MLIHKLPLADAVLIDAEPYYDQRGIFSRFFCSRELTSVMGEQKIVNVNFSRTSKKGSIRGLHFQRHPFAEIKLVRCIRGSIFDVIVDIRTHSATFLQWHAETLTADNMKMIVVPEGFAHGFQTLEDESELLYLCTAFYSSDAEGGLRYNDPVLNISWPLGISDISEKDASHPLLVSDMDPLGKT